MNSEIEEGRDGPEEDISLRNGPWSYIREVLKGGAKFTTGANKFRRFWHTFLSFARYMRTSDGRKECRLDTKRQRPLPDKKVVETLLLLSIVV